MTRESDKTGTDLYPYSLDSFEGLPEPSAVQGETRRARLWNEIRRLAPGLGMCGLISAAASFVAAHYGAPEMLFALLLGMTFNFLREDVRFVPGIQFASRTLLRLGVGLIGIRLTLADITAFGIYPVVLVIACVGFTILLGVLIGRALGLSRDFSILSGGATAICGASAALAISSVLPRSKSSEQETIVVIIGVTSLSTVAMVLYPVLIQTMGLSDYAAGLFMGATIHDVAQVVGAGYSVSEPAGDTATYVKLLRVALLLPVIIGLSVVLHAGMRGAAEGDAPGASRPPLVPWFLMLFIGCVLAASFLPWPQAVPEQIASLSRWALIGAVAGIGLKTSFRTVLKIGPRAILLLVLQTVCLAAFAAALLLALSPSDPF